MWRMENSIYLNIPKNIRINEDYRSLQIEVSWFKPKYLLAFILIPTFTYFIIQSDFVNGSLSTQSLPVYLLFGLNIVLMGYCFIRLITSSIINVNQGRMWIDHKPIRIQKVISVNKENIAQLYVAKQLKVNKWYGIQNTYQVNLIQSNGREMIILQDLQSIDQAKFIEKKIEDFLNIVDVPVIGEA